MKRRSIWISAIALVTLLVTACGGGAKMTSSTTASPAADSARGAPGSAYQASSPAAAPKAETDKSTVPPGTVVSTTVANTSDSKMIMNADLELKIKDADDVVAKITAAVKQAGGFVQDNRFNGAKGKGRTVQITLRVPAGSYADMVGRLASLADEVINRREWTQNVTEQYLDLEARIKTQEIHLQQLQKLYDKSGSIKEMMDLEQEIARVTADLESLKGRYRLLNNQIDYSTINVKLYEPDAPTPIQPPKNVWERIRVAFKQSTNGVVNFTADLAVVLVGSLPVLVYLAVLGGVGYVAYRAVRRRFRRPPTE